VRRAPPFRQRDHVPVVSLCTSGASACSYARRVRSENKAIKWRMKHDMHDIPCIVLPSLVTATSSMRRVLLVRVFEGVERHDKGLSERNALKSMGGSAQEYQLERY